MREIDEYVLNSLSHADHKYIKREKVNGKWRYWYQDTIKTTNKLFGNTTKSTITTSNGNTAQVTTRNVGLVGRALGVDKKYERSNAKNAKDAAKSEADAANTKRETVVKNAMSDGKLDEKERAQIKSASDEHNKSLEKYRQAIKEYDDAEKNFGSTPIGAVSKGTERAKKWVNNLFDDIKKTAKDVKDTADAYKEYRDDRTSRDRHDKDAKKAESQYNEAYKKAMSDGDINLKEMYELSDLQNKHYNSTWDGAIASERMKSSEAKLKSTKYGEKVTEAEKKIDDAKEWLKKLFKK